MKLTETLKQRSALVLMLAPLLLLVVVGLFAQHANAPTAAGTAIAVDNVDTAEVTRSGWGGGAIVVELLAERARQREAELAAMTCDQLHAERVIQAARPLPPDTVQKVRKATSEPVDVSWSPHIAFARFDLDAAIAELGPRFSDIPNSNTDPVDAHIEARCPTG